VLLSAKEAIYPQDRLRAVSPERLRRYCLRGDGDSEGQVLLQDKIRERVQFGRLNLCQPVDGIGPFDVIFLRNVLIYFRCADQDRGGGSGACHAQAGGPVFSRHRRRSGGLQDAVADGAARCLSQNGMMNIGFHGNF
jgi:hypothetical protein